MKDMVGKSNFISGKGKTFFISLKLFVRNGV